MFAIVEKLVQLWSYDSAEKHSLIKTIFGTEREYRQLPLTQKKHSYNDNIIFLSYSVLISLHKVGFDSLICIDKQINHPEVWAEPGKDTNPLIHGTDWTESLVLYLLALPPTTTLTPQTTY